MNGEWEKCQFAVVTALPKEFAAMLAMLDDMRPITVSGDPNDYAFGKIAAIDGSGNHHVVVALQKKPANNSASAVASHLSHSFPHLEHVFDGRNCWWSSPPHGRGQERAPW